MSEAKLRVKLLTSTPEPETAIALAGRLCYSASDVASLRDAVSKDPGAFIKKLVALGHLSPLEHASFTLGAEGVSRALLAQITRHRIASFSVQSQRYVKQDSLSYIVPPSVKALGLDAVEEFEREMAAIEGFYQKWLERGLAAEDARFVLPNAAETRMVFTMNARELMHFFSLRTCARAQWEIRALAWAALGIVRREAPTIFGNSGPSCLHGPCSEGKMSCGRAEDMRALSAALDAFLETRPEDDAITAFIENNLS